LFDAVITNTRLDASHPPYWRSDVVAAAWHAQHDAEVLTADVVDQDNAVRHDPHKLAQVIIQAWTRHQQERGAAFSPDLLGAEQLLAQALTDLQPPASSPPSLVS
jgi:hypothetical protein